MLRHKPVCWLFGRLRTVVNSSKDNSSKLIRQMMKNHKITLQKLEGLRDINIFLEFHTLTVVNGLKYWLTSREVHMSADEALEFYRFLMSHPILDVVGQVEDYTEQEQTEG